MKISKSNGYAISWLFSHNKTVEEISKELKLNLETIKSYIEKNPNLMTKDLPIKTGPATSKDLMIRHTRDKKTNSVAIMTKEASERNDASRDRFKNISNNKPHIFKPNK